MQLMGENIHLLRRAFHHLVGALPQLKPFNGIGNTTYAIVVPAESNEVTLSGPALTIDGIREWPHVAQAAAREFFQKKRRDRYGITVLLVVSVEAVWHCAAVGIPLAEKSNCDESTPLACANSVLEDAPTGSRAVH
jgi:hypothetical protein